MSLLSLASERRLDLDRIWKEQAIPAQLHDLLLKTAKPVHDHIVESASGRNVTEWCKKADCWKKIQTIGLSVPSALLARGAARTRA